MYYVVAKNDLSDYTRSALEKEIKKLRGFVKRHKKYGISYNDKEEDVVEKLKTKAPVLKEFKEKRITSSQLSGDNILIEGDNFHSLSILNYTHSEKIDMIYIDPPFNTGARGWMYDNDYVDENETWPHTKWLSMMKHRLEIAKKLLKPNGVLCCAIDDYELFSLLGLFEKLKARVLGIIVVVIKPEGRNQEKYIMTAHEYAIFVTWGNPKIRLLEPRAEIKQYKNALTDVDGKLYRWSGFLRRGPESNPRKSNRWYPIYVSKNNEISVTKQKGWTAVFPINTNGDDKIWDWGKDRLDEYLKTDKDQFRAKRKKNNGKEIITIDKKIYKQDKSKPLSYWKDAAYSPQAYGNKLVQAILGGEREFPFPKSVYTVIDCIDSFLPEDGIVLDFFAGSGTTGHSTLMLNDRDGGSRRFILCTNNECSKEELKKLEKSNASEEGIQNEGICRKICYPRMKNVINGWFKEKNPQPHEKTLKSNLRYFKIDFTDAAHTDINKKKLADRCTEMLCLKEDCFEEETIGKNFKIFKNKSKKYFGIVNGITGIEPIIQKIKKINTEMTVYILSYDGGNKIEEFEQVEKLVNLEPIPDDILNTFEQSYKAAYK